MFKSDLRQAAQAGKCVAFIINMSENGRFVLQEIYIPNYNMYVLVNMVCFCKKTFKT